MTQARSLAGIWDFQPDPQAEFTPDHVSFTRTIPVPLPWQAAFPDLARYSGYAWYQRTFVLDDDWLAGEVLLTFGAVDYLCNVYINGQHAGAHEGGYTPFTLAIGRLLQAGENRITVRVYDPVQQGGLIERHPHFPLEPAGQQPPGPLSVPHGKQEWYAGVGGIWQDVTLRAVPATHIDHVRVVTALDGTVQVRVRLHGAEHVAVQAAAGRGDQVVAEATATAAAGEAELTLRVPDPRWWSPDSPNLYTLRVRAGTDEREIRFGIRTIETRDGRLLLNGEPFYLVAALDQDFYRETIYTVPSDDFLRDQFRKARELGLNCLRCHIKAPDPRYLDLADEIGLLVWAEIPSWRTFYPKGTAHEGQTDLDDHVRGRVEQTLHEMIRRDCNHPSLIIWTMVNEDWGTMLPFSSADRAWVSSLYGLCKQLDPTRLVVDNSPCTTPWGPNLHVQSDLEDWHTYSNIPDAAQDFVRMVEQLNLRPLWTYSSHGDSTRRGDEPVIVSEFGNWGLVAVEPFLHPDGSEPDWFDLGPWWSSWDGEPGWMKGVLQRFERLGLAEIFGSYDAFALATQWHQYQAMKFEIEAMRRQSGIMGYVITEFTDCYWEGNGLLDFDRRPKAYHAALRQFNAEDVLAPQQRQYAAWAGEELDLRVFGSRFTAADWTGATLEIALDGQSAQTTVTEAPRGEVRLVTEVALPLANVSHAAVKTAELRLTDPAGVELTRNTASVLVLPRSAASAACHEPVAVIDQRDAWMDGPPPLMAALRGVGYSVSDQLGQARLAVSSAPTPELLRWVRAGGSLLFLCSGPSPFFWAQSRGGAYGGNWMSCWSWLRPDAHPRLAHPELNPLKLPFLQIMPRLTITGLPVEEPAVQADFLAGQVTGWVNHPAIHTVQFGYGAGRVIMTTFALAGATGTDPVGTAMLHDLVDRLASDQIQPVLRGNW